MPTSTETVELIDRDAVPQRGETLAVCIDKAQGYLDAQRRRAAR